MFVGVPREIFPGERRVALVPAVIPNLKKAGLEVVVEAGAGVEAGYPDAEYTAKGASLLAERAEVFRHGRHHSAGVLVRLQRRHRPARPARCCGPARC